MGRLFVVDTENTNDYSFIDKYSLDKGDSIVLFISENMQGIKSTGCLALFNTKAKVLTEEVKVGEKNLLDFQLVAFVTEKAVRKKFECIYIVSNDHGYREVANYIETKYNTNIMIIEKKNTVEKSVSSKKVEDIKPKEVVGLEEVKKIIKEVIPNATNNEVVSVNKWRNENIELGELHNRIVKLFGDKGKVLYPKIKQIVKK